MRFNQAAILDNGYSEMTSLLVFHPFEPALIVADERDGVSIWNFEVLEMTWHIGIMTWHIRIWSLHNDE